MKSFNYCLVIFFISFNISLFGQGVDTTAFPESDREALYKEIEKVLTEFKREDCDQAMSDLKTAIKERRMTEQHYEGFLKLTNVMVKRKMKRWNYILPVLSTIIKFAQDDNLTSQYFDRWIDISVKILEDQDPRKTFIFENYLKWSYEFWINNNLYKISLGSHTWKSESKNFDIKYENKELSVSYTNATLYCFNKADSLTIKNATGTYYPLKGEGGLWVGKSGTVDWNHDGARDARCQFKDFSFNAKQTSYKVDNATLSYTSVFKAPLEGTFSDRISRRTEVVQIKDPKTKEMVEVTRTPPNLSYPRFASKSRNIKIDDIGEGVDYYGGFRLEGSVVRGYGDENGRSIIYISNAAGQVVAKAVSKDFDIFKGERVVSSDAEVSLYLHHDGGIDSIYHPNTRITFNIQKREITLDRGKSKSSRVPFFNSLQQSELKTSFIKWPIDSDKIDIGNNEENLEMNSDKFFDDDVNEKYRLITTINPLIKFALYSEKLGQSTQEIKDGTCNGTNDWSGFDDEPESLDELCARDPTQCPEWYLEELENKKNNPDPINEDNPDVLDPPAPEEGTIDIGPPFDPRRIPAAELLVLLDKRMEKLNIMSCSEIEKVKKNPAFKIIKSHKDWKDFERNFPKKYKFGAIDATDVLSFTNDVVGPSHNIQNGWTLIQDMIADGFVTFDYKDSLVVLREKLFHYKNSANTKDKEHDFDRIKIKSVPSSSQKRESNAVLDIKSQEMETSGVQSFVLSDSQNVWCEPFRQKVVMKKNRDMDFDGIMTAGMLRFTGQNFHFSYQDYNVVMDSVDYVDFYIYEREVITQEESEEYAGFFKSSRVVDEAGFPSKVTVPIRNQLRNTKGILLIDISTNKSGKMASAKNMPSFDCLDTSYVYFERQNRMNKYGEKIYSSENFYYQVFPFVLDKLDRYDPEKLSFRGRFYSAGILPLVTEPLKVMFMDLSFGFETETPGDEGYPIYLREDANKGKGRFTGLFGMSNQGLIGKGRLDYLGATIESEYIEFLPERFVTDKVDSFTLREEVIDGVEFPKVLGEQVFIDWMPYNDSMFIESDIENNVPFQLFEKGEHALTGSLNLTPRGLLGRGIFEWDEAEMKSNPGGDFVFGRNSVTSASTSVSIKQQGDLAFAFSNDNVEAVVDFDKRVGDFIAQEKDLSTDLPYNSYKTSLDRFHWDMDKKNIHIDATQGKAGFFLATEMSQDSLFFLGESADYDLNTGLLQIDGVDHIRVADAFIYPKDRHVEIEEASHMRTLEDSRVLADTANQNHQIQRATINVLSKREYTATGYLEFNVEGHKEQEVFFSEVRVKQDGRKYITTGSGNLEETDSFYLDNRTRFKGEVHLSAESKNLTFAGYAKLASKVIPYPQWFTINSQIDKKNVSIDYKVPQNPDGESLFVGLFLGMDSLYLYPCILAPKDNNQDRSIFSAQGVIQFDRQNQMYMFGDSAKVLGKAEAGKLFTVSEANAKVTAEGKFDFSQGFNKEGMPPVQVECAGDFSFFMDKASDYRFEMVTLLDFYFPEVLSSIIIEDLNSNEETKEEYLYTSVRNAKLKSRLKEFVKDEAAYEKMWKLAADDNRLILPETLKHTFFFPTLVLKWSEKTQSFVSQGNLGLSSIGGKHIGQIIKGALEVQIDPLRGDVLTFYITSPNGDWYYFQYANGILTTASSNPNYNNAVTGMKRKDAKIRTDNGASFEVVIGNAAQYSQFRQRANSAF